MMKKEICNDDEDNSENERKWKTNPTRAHALYNGRISDIFRPICRAKNRTNKENELDEMMKKGIIMMTWIIVKMKNIVRSRWKQKPSKHNNIL